MYRVLKRFLDIVLSGIAILVLLPFMIPIMIGLKLTGEGYIFYKQERIGLNNKPFHILKFATMLKDSPNMKGGMITTKGDPRITPMGGFLRKTKINELPQLFNIFLGDMSIVGPRPLVTESLNRYPEELRNKVYLNVKPGLSGIGSIVFRDEESIVTKVKGSGEDLEAFLNNDLFPHKAELEIWYKENRSLWVDVKIIFVTMWVVLFPDSDIVYKAFPSLPRRPF